MKTRKVIFGVIVLLVALFFSVSTVALAEPGEEPSQTQSVSETTSQEDNNDASDTKTDEEETASEPEEGDETGSEETSTIGATGSKVSSASASTTSKTSSTKGNNSNIGGRVDDGVDTSGWGTGESEPQSVGTQLATDGDKDIFDYAKWFSILIWIPIVLIIASVAALIYVNRKGFLAGVAATKNNSKKAAKKSSKHNQIYRPRD